MKALFTIAVCCLVAAPAVTQVKRGKAQERIKRKVEAMRKAMRAGKILEFNVFVRVKLKNGNRMKGVVKNGKFVELQDGIDFVSVAQLDDKRAGMRVWYTVGTNSFVFLRYEEIERYSIGSKLSDAQVKSIELKLAQELTDTRENYRRMRDLRLRQIEEKKKLAAAGKVGKTDDPDAPPDLKATQMKLLKEFPPDDGWGAEKLEKLKSRRVVLGVYPNEKERRFEKSFAAWKAAFDANEKILEYKETAKKQKKSEPGDSDKAKGDPAAKPPGSTGASGKPSK
jgi:hypothetical protein